MKFKISSSAIFIGLVQFGFYTTIPNVWSYDEIIRPYRSVRSEGMGGVRIATGLYDENFYGNPARSIHNPIWRVQLPGVSVETNKFTYQSAKEVSKVASDMTKISSYLGKNLYARVQTPFPAVYLPSLFDESWSIDFGVMTSVMVDIMARRNYTLSPILVVDTGPALTVAKNFGDHFTIGVTPHMSMRASTKKSFGLVDFFKGTKLDPKGLAGQGTHIDLDVGTLYDFSPNGWDVTWSIGASVNNALGGKYKNIKLRPIPGLGSDPMPQKRAFNWGVAAYKPSLWIFDEAVLAFDMTDIGVNKGGSVYRLFHLGYEMDLGPLSLRTGINQGYFCGGLGLDLWFFQLDFATYGEELSLVTGRIEDRRYALKIDFRI